ncbi:hypothetical protein JCM8202v2_001870 [Rhodotorula sphaerocarpa]
MRLSFFLAALVAAPSALALASAPEAEVPASAPADQSPALALHTDHKRSLCLFGFCIGGSGGDAGGSTGGGWSSTPSTPDYMNDENNCGRAGNRCPTSCSNGSGAVCVQGRCLPRYCSPGFVRNDATATCVNLASDPSNCGAIGHACALDNAASHTCAGGVCQALACQSGCGLYSGSCKNLQTDPNHCGSLENVCQFPGGTGTCQRGVCTLTSCAAGFTQQGGKCVRLNLQEDVNNCGAVGHVCAVPNGVAGCSGGQCFAASCAQGYTSAGTQCVKMDLSSDASNCGAPGHVCSFSNGQGVCQAGKCTYTSCSTRGYQLVGNNCVRVDLSSDPKNCGSVGNVCQVTNGVGACTEGTCTIASCSPGFQVSHTSTWWGASSSSCTPVNTNSDPANCGAAGHVCNFENGSGKCMNGVCTYTSCSTPGSYLVNNKCSSLDLLRDPKNCGSVGHVCSVANGVASCEAGSCSIASCNDGFARQRIGQGWAWSGLSSTCEPVNTQSDTLNCGSVGHVCPSSYRNGGASTCVNGRCSTNCDYGHDFDHLYNFCRPVLSDNQNCGRCGQTCSIPHASAQVCSNGQCLATSCEAGYMLVNNACTMSNFQNDVMNCGAAGHKCNFSPSGASGVCQAGTCVTTSCPFGYTLMHNSCVLTASGQAHSWGKRSKIQEPKKLCPGSEQACPIEGSALFEDARSQHLKAGAELTGLMTRLGSYECIDTTQALESCGGCTATGEGQDCTAIAHAAGVGCEAGKCILFSCEAGYKPSLDNTRCIRPYRPLDALSIAM